MNKKFIALLIILFVLLLAFSISTFRKLHEVSMQNSILEEQVSTLEVSNLEESISSLLPDETNHQAKKQERKLYSLYVSEKAETEQLIPQTEGKILLFRDDFFKEPSNFTNLKLEDFWKDKLSGIDEYSEFNTVEELTGITENDIIIIQTTTCSSNFSELYSQCMQQKTSTKLNIVILSSYESTNLSMAEQYGRYIDDFLSASLENGATIRILYPDGFEQTYEYSIK